MKKKEEEEEEGGGPGGGLQPERQPGAVGEPQGGLCAQSPVFLVTEPGCWRGAPGVRKGWRALCGSSFFSHRPRGLCRLLGGEWHEVVCVGQVTAQGTVGGGAEKDKGH